MLPLTNNHTIYVSVKITKGLETKYAETVKNGTDWHNIFIINFLIRCKHSVYILIYQEHATGERSQLPNLGFHTRFSPYMASRTYTNIIITQIINKFLQNGVIDSRVNRLSSER